MASNAIITEEKNKFKIPTVLVYFGKNFQRFLCQTSLQALPFVGNASLKLWERIYFLLCFVAVVIVASILSMNIYARWETTPIIIGMESETTSIYSIPFPAVTFCNMNQISHRQIRDLPVNSVEYAMVQKICFLDFNYRNFTNQKPRFKGDTFSNFIYQNGQSCDNMIVYCKFGDTIDRCSDFFREVILDEGFCCSFNMLHPTFAYKGPFFFARDYTSSEGRVPVDWNPETGYQRNLPSNFYPRIAEGDGLSMGLTVVLNANVSDYHCSSTSSAGLKVVLHNPIDTPHAKETGLLVQIGYQNLFRIRTLSSKALPTIRGINPKSRQCYFNNEFKLLFYKYYTRRNCEMECDSKYMFKQCNCIPYDMPLIYANVTACFIDSFDCVVAAEKQSNRNEHFACKQECLPSCTDLAFFPDLFKTPLTEGDYKIYSSFFRGYSQEYMHENLALAQFFFPKDSFRSTLKTPYTGFTEYLSLTGGIMSLMMGFSVVSISEAFYFFIMRPIFDLVLGRPVDGGPHANLVVPQNDGSIDLAKMRKINRFRARNLFKHKPQQQGIATRILNTRKGYGNANIGTLKTTLKFKSTLSNNEFLE